MSGLDNVRRVEHKSQNDTQHSICKCADPKQLRRMNAGNGGAVEVKRTVPVPTPPGASKGFAVALRASAPHAWRYGWGDWIGSLDKVTITEKVLNVDLTRWFGIYHRPILNQPLQGFPFALLGGVILFALEPLYLDMSVNLIAEH